MLGGPGIPMKPVGKGPCGWTVGAPAAGAACRSAAGAAVVVAGGGAALGVAGHGRVA